MENLYDACCRTNVGGYHVTDYLKQLLSLKYPHHMSKLTWEKVEDLKMEHCYIAPDYAAEVRLFQGTRKLKKTRCWQLPWTPSPMEEAPSEEEIARKAALKEKQGQRLREMAEAKRICPCKGNTSLRKAKGEPVESVEKMDPSSTEKYNLINVPDEMLTPEQLKQKRKQLFIKSTSEARQLKKQKQVEEELERERQRKLEEERRLENPERYLEELRAKHRDLSEKVEQRKKLKTNGGHTNGNHNASGGVGRGERLNPSQRERMRLLTTAAFDRGKGEDTFGAKDEDWQLYKLMSKDNDDDDDDKPDPDEAELARISSRLQEIDPTFIFKSESGSSSAEPPRFRPLTMEDFQIILGVERFRCPEILFNPNLIGIDQAGLDEMAGISIRRLPSKGQGLEEKITSSILLIGGSCLFPGMSERLEAGIRMTRPCGTPIKIYEASDPILDAWRGASTYAAAMQFPQQTFSRMDYYEKGEDWLRSYQLRYTI
ncbi:UNVERIFIED_CONTAM: Actin-related protein 5 [Sesamum angustifolium]|uniref:Actin-related protein 5 n=1 Tax=Sesamum angustifolium TaxID=2727405 RepID=A0AAW2J3C6_9LAMI